MSEKVALGASEQLPTLCNGFAEQILSANGDPVQVPFVALAVA